MGKLNDYGVKEITLIREGDLIGFERLNKEKLAYMDQLINEVVYLLHYHSIDIEQLDRIDKALTYAKYKEYHYEKEAA